MVATTLLRMSIGKVVLDLNGVAEMSVIPYVSDLQLTTNSRDHRH